MDIYYLSAIIKPFPDTRKNKGYYVFIDRMKKGSANTIERRVLEGKTKQEALGKLKEYVSSYEREFSYINL